MSDHSPVVTLCSPPAMTMSVMPLRGMSDQNDHYSLFTISGSYAHLSLNTGLR